MNGAGARCNGRRAARRATRKGWWASVEMLREFAPFVIGTILPPLVMLAMRASWSGRTKFVLAFLPALVLGFCTSLFAGELAGDIPEGLMAIIIDTSLVFTGSQLAYRFF